MPKPIAIVGEVFDEQVDEMVCRGAHADIPVPRGWEQTDEMDQAEDAPTQGVLLPLLVDQRLRLLEEQPRAVQVFILLGVEEVRTNHSAQ